MTMGEREEVFLDFLPRIEYGVLFDIEYNMKDSEVGKIPVEGIDNGVAKLKFETTESIFDAFLRGEIDLRAKLRPMDERAKYYMKTLEDTIEYENKMNLPHRSSPALAELAMKFMLANHYDYKGLIECGLALPAREDEYGDETEE